MKIQEKHQHDGDDDEWYWKFESGRLFTFGINIYPEWSDLKWTALHQHSIHTINMHIKFDSSDHLWWELTSLL